MARSCFKFSLFSGARSSSNIPSGRRAKASSVGANRVIGPLEVSCPVIPALSIASSSRVNEPAAAGAYEALKALGREKDVLIVSVDGGCPGVQNIKDGVIGATSMQFPLLMASMGIEAIKAFAESGEKPKSTPGLDFFNTGVELITDKPADGVPSISSAEGLKKCWG